jgi:broad specificity phosphatase PhoE
MGAGDVILVRHADADYDVLDTWSPTFTGMRRDFAPLSKTGAAQAQELATRLKSERVRLIVSSPYTRSLHTAAVIATDLACPIAVDVRLHDWLPVHDGRLPISGAIVAEKISEYEQFAMTGELPPVRTWETAHEMRERLTTVISDHRSDLPVALVTHEAPIQSIVGRVPVPVASAHVVEASTLLGDGISHPTTADGGVGR